MPSAFVRLVEDSLTGLFSCVRTVYGHTCSFAVQRSLRQGDPFAPLLFVLGMVQDALLDVLELNSFTGQRNDCVLQWPGGLSVELASLCYVDDTTLLANSLARWHWRFDRRLLDSFSPCSLLGCCLSLAQLAK